LYEDWNDGLRLWFIADTGERFLVHQPMQVTFFATGSNTQLRELWIHLRRQPGVVSLSRVMRRDVFLPEAIPLLQVVIDNPIRQTKIFRELQEQFPFLTYYDTDIDVTTRLAATTGLFTTAFCDVEVDEGGAIYSLHVLNSRWDLNPNAPLINTLSIEPNCDPAREKPTFLRIAFKNHSRTVSLYDPERLITRLNEFIDQIDPDIIYTHWGDTWVIPHLLQVEKQVGLKLHFNRDQERDVHWQKEITYFSYGQIIHRASEAHFFGRCHIDKKNALMWSDYELEGVLESARVTTLPIEKAARVSPGSGISAMETLTALEQQILVPWHKQQNEFFKTGLDLIQRDRGGLVYQPLLGLHEDVAQLDFISMYPAIIITGNISPELPLPNGITPSCTELGLVPRTLKPLYEKRVALKKHLATLRKNDPVAQKDSARASALKWLLVVCFGFLGYKNAKFGRIESHEAVTNGGREVILMAKETAEELGFEVLQIFVDAIWVKKTGAKYNADFIELQEAIAKRTGLGINLDGVYRWIAFLPSRLDARVPVANRYFGCFRDNEIKVRGIEMRRKDTTPWVKEVQKKMIETLAESYNIESLQVQLKKAFEIFRASLSALRSGQVPIEKLVVATKISKKLEVYKSTSPGVRAARMLLEKTGKRTTPGQRIRYLFVKGEPGVYPWECPPPSGQYQIDIEKYIELLARAGSSIFLPFGVKEAELKKWAHSGTLVMEIDFEEASHVREIYSDVRSRGNRIRVRFQTDSCGLAAQR
jgi:DNA polymerase-2